MSSSVPFALNRYRLLGNSGLRVSPLCLGAMTFGDRWSDLGMGSTKEEVEKILDLYVSKGGNFIDTANVYQFGQSEQWLGEWMQKRGVRDQLVIATKYSSRPHPDCDVNACGNARKSLMQNVEGSLQRLQTSYIDLLYVHYWDWTTPIEEIMRGLDDLVRSGKVHYVAVSDAPAWVVSQANTLARERGWVQFIAYQGRYSLVDRDLEREVLPMSASNNLGCVPWGVLGQGKLTGKYQRGKDPESAERNKWTGFSVTEKEFDIAEKVQSIAKEINKTPSQVALNWMLCQNRVTAPLIGCRLLRHLEDNLGALEFQLSEEHLKTLDEVSQNDVGFPLNFIGASFTQSPWLFWGDKSGSSLDPRANFFSY